ncbi:MAG: hypothetical protein R3B13_13010 [Polyangiaceae bacterium]
MIDTRTTRMTLMLGALILATSAACSGNDDAPGSGGNAAAASSAGASGGGSAGIGNGGSAGIGSSGAAGQGGGVAAGGAGGVGAVGGSAGGGSGGVGGASAGGGGSSGASGAGAGGSGGSGGNFVVSDCGASVLKSEAAKLGVGGVVELTGTGYGTSLVDASLGHHVLQYSDKGVWDPNTCQALFVGGGHLSLVKYLAYSASQNKFFQAPNPNWWCDATTATNKYACSTHAYGHNALDPKTGRMFFRKFNSDTVYAHQVDATIDSDWSTLPKLPSSAGGCIATGIEYFPARDELVYVDCTSGSLQTSKTGTAAWKEVPGPFTMGPYHNYAVHNPVHEVVLFGLGNDSKGLYKFDASGKVTAVAQPPRTFHPSPADGTTLRILTADPASGKYLAVSMGGDLFEYDVPTDKWSANAKKLPQDLQIAIPISSYGVVMFLTTSKVYLYKHG